MILLVKIWNYLSALRNQSDLQISESVVEVADDFKFQSPKILSSVETATEFGNRFRILVKSSLRFGLDRLAVELLVGKDDGLRSVGLLALFCTVGE